MDDSKKTVFISYRRSATWAVARLIYSNLRENGYDVFMDVNSLESGEFEKVIFSEITARTHFLPILAPGVVERFINPNDLMRREIEYAMNLKRNIVPIIVDEFNFTNASKFLIGKLGSLGNYNGIIISHEFFDSALEQLRNRFLTKEPTPDVNELDLTINSQPNLEVSKQTKDYRKSTEEKLSAEIYLNRGYSKSQYDPQGAIEDFTHAIELNPESAHAYRNRGAIYYSMGELDRALKDFQKAIRFAPREPIYYNYRGAIYEQQGKLDKAIADYRKAIRLKPNSIDTVYAYINIGNSLYNKKKYQDAILEYTKAIKINPKSAAAFNQRGNARYFQKDQDIDGAFADFDEAIRLDPTLASAYLNKGSIQYRIGNYTDAIFNYTKAITINPKLSWAYVERGKARYYIQGDIENALRDFDEAIRINPKEAWAYNNKGWIFYNQGETDKAFVEFNEAISYSPELAKPYYNRGRVYKDKGNITAAIDDFLQAIQLDPNQVEPYYYLATSYQEQGKIKDALENYQKYLSLGSGLKDVSEAAVMRTIKELKKQLE